MTKRRPRYKRCKVSERTPFSFVKGRDDLYLKAVHDYRTLDVEQIIQLFPQFSEQTTRRRLRQLFDRDYLVKSDEQKERYRSGGGSYPDLYRKGDAASEVLARTFGIPRTKTKLSHQNRNSSRGFLAHTLDNAAALLKFELACRDSGNHRLRHLSDILAAAPAAMRERPRAHQWPVEIMWNGKRHRDGVEPDAIFSIEELSGVRQGKKGYLFLEVDEGTESINASSAKQSSIKEKLLKYAYTHKRHLHTDYFGAKNFRVLFVITTKSRRMDKSRERIGKCLKAVERYTTGVCWPATFLFADLQTFNTSNPLTMPWINGKGETVTVVPKFDVTNVTNRKYDLTIPLDAHT